MVNKVNLDKMERMERLDHKDCLVYQDLKVKVEIRDLWENKDLREILVHLVFKVPVEILERMVFLVGEVCLVHLDLLVKEVCLVHLVQEDSKECLDLLAKMAHLEKMVKWDYKDLLE